MDSRPAIHLPYSLSLARRLSPAVALLLFVILPLATFVRTFGLTWDHGYLFHPDERQILFVTAELSLPTPFDLQAFFSVDSPWNPGFFSYGSFPLYLLRVIASAASQVWPAFESLRSFYVIGRVLSSLADLITIGLVFALGRRLYDETVGLLGASLVSLTVLHVQLAHFYAVDTLLTAAVMLVLYLSVRVVERPRLAQCIGLGMACGMACATKVSAAALVVPVTLAWVGAQALAQPVVTEGWRTRLGAVASESLRGLIAIGWVAAVTFLVLEPYALIDLTSFLRDVSTESMMVRGQIDVPYTRQYIATTPYLYPIAQAITWSMGIPLGVAGFVGSALALVHAVSQLYRKQWFRALMLLVPLSWYLVYFGITGSFHTKFLRYMLPVLPLLCLWGAALLVALIRQRRRVVRYAGYAALAVTLVASGLYVVAYLRIYASTHPWEQATDWICREIPAGSTLMVEHWDHPLPMMQGRGPQDCWGDYRSIQFPAYDPDDDEKLTQLVATLQVVDYIVISSNRLYGSISRLPERYPLTARYYQRLFAEELGFELVYFAQVYPQLGPVRIVHDTLSAPGLPTPALLAQQGRGPADLVLGYADESYSVYDHPMPLIFRRAGVLSPGDLRRALDPVADGLD
jgi:hypothetical protein